MQKGENYLCRPRGPICVSTPNCCLFFSSSMDHQAYLLFHYRVLLRVLNQIEIKNEQSLHSFDKGDIFLFFFNKQDQRTTPQLNLAQRSRLEKILNTYSKKKNGELLDVLKQEFTFFTITIIRLDHINSRSINYLQQIKLTSHISQVKLVRHFVNEICKDIPGNAVAMRDALQITLTEIFTNIVQHGYHNRCDGHIYLKCEELEEGLSIEIRDQGDIFDLSHVPHPSFTTEEERGFGWYIIKSLVDEISYQPKSSLDRWNYLRIFKRFLFNGDAMKILHQQEGDILVITPCCDSLDLNETREFKEQLIDLINLEAASKVVLVLDKIQYIDSSGLGSLLSILKFLRSKGGELKLASLNPAVRTIFELVAMHKIFGIYPSTEEAINSYR